MRGYHNIAGAFASMAVTLLLLCGGLAAYGTTGGPIQTPVDDNSGSIGHVFSLQVVPLVDYLLLPEGISCNYGRGYAGISLNSTGTTVGMRVEGAQPNASFAVVMSAGGVNYTLGSLVTNGSGEGQFAGSVSFSSPPTALSLHMRFAGTVPPGCFSLDMVGVPNPLVLTQASSTTSHEQTTTESTLSASSTTSHEGEGSGGGQSVLHIQLVPVPQLLHVQTPPDYAFSGGNATFEAQGYQLLAAVDFKGLSNTQYTVVMRLNDHNVTIGSTMTAADGAGHVEYHDQLVSGTYTIGVMVYEGDHSLATSWVGSSQPLVQPFVVTGTSGVSTTQTETETGSHTEGQGGSPEGGYFAYLHLLPVAGAGVPQTYRYGNATAFLSVNEGILSVLLGVHEATPNTQLKFVLSLGNSQNVTLGTLFTSDGGNGEMKSEVALPSGVLSLAMFAYDESSFANPILVMRGSLSGTYTVTSSPTTNSTSHGERPNVMTGSDSEVDSAIQSRSIPAVIELSDGVTRFNVLDHNFSVSVGQTSQRGVLITVSAQNVTGPRTLLININGTTAQAIQSGSFQVLFDGQQVQEASSLTQVLNPLPGGQAAYVVVQTASGLQLFVEVPHFSVHTIEILGIPIAAVQNLFEVDAPVLAGSVLVVTLLFGALYATRKRVFAFFV